MHEYEWIYVSYDAVDGLTQETLPLVASSSPARAQRARGPQGQAGPS